MQKLLGRFLTYLFRGIIVIAPITVTIYIIFGIFHSIDDSLNDVIEKVTGYRFPFLGIVVGVFLFTFIGFLSSLFLFRPLFAFFERIITHTPLVKIIYSSIKDLIDAFVGNNKKFSQPVLINFNSNPRFQRLGYLTGQDLSHLGITGKVAVYIPHSYAISGNVFIVPEEDITLINAPSSEVMKFIVSGGVTHLDGDKGQ